MRLSVQLELETSVQSERTRLLSGAFPREMQQQTEYTHANRVVERQHIRRLLCGQMEPDHEIHQRQERIYLLASERRRNAAENRHRSRRRELRRAVPRRDRAHIRRSEY